MVALAWILVLYAVFSFGICLFVVTRIVGPFGNGNPKVINEKKKCKFFLIIPLLEEQRLFCEMYERFKNLVDKDSDMELFYVTTEREKIENSVGKTTIDLLNEKILSENNLRIHVLHYPCYNKVVADQLNFAVQKIIEEFGYDENYCFGFFNADSLVSPQVFSELKGSELNHKNQKIIFQQSSLFLSNIQTLVSTKKYFLSSFGLYQSYWTIRHEVPQYALDVLLHRLRLSSKYNLLYCVLHGLFIPFDRMKEIGGFPNLDLGCEDIAMGYKAKIFGCSVFPIPVLENSETPKDLKSLVTQLKHWYLGSLGYLSYWRNINGPGNKLQIFILSLIGLVINPLKWLLRGPLILLLLIVSISAGTVGMTITSLLIYIYFPLVPILFLWKKLDAVTFPKLQHIDLLKVLMFYPVVPVLRSIPAFLGLFLYVKMLLGFNFIKTKTERP
jgi:hypothetical protein